MLTNFMSLLYFASRLKIRRVVELGTINVGSSMAIRSEDLHKGENRMTRIPISQADEQARRLKDRLDLSTAEIGLQVRTTNCLEEKGIFSVRDLLNSTPETLLSIANFGEKTLEEVYVALEKIGYNRPWRKPR